MTRACLTRSTAIVAQLLAIVMLLLACSHDKPGDETPRVLRYALDGAPTSSDPLFAGDGYAGFLIVNLYDTLYRYQYLSRPYVLTPNLAEGMPTVSDDGLIYTFTIKSARFPDHALFPGGRPVTAADVVYSLKRHFQPQSGSQGAWLWREHLSGLDDWVAAGADLEQAFSGLRVLDEQRFQIRLKAPFPQLPYTLATPFSAIVPHEAVTRAEGIGRQPVGSGPYRLTALDSSRALLIANPDYREERFDIAAEGFDPQRHGNYGIAQLADRALPITAQVEIGFVADSDLRFAALRKADGLAAALLPHGRADDWLAGRDPMQLAAPHGQHFHVQAALESTLIHWSFNMDDPDVGASDDPQLAARNHALRCAIDQVFDWQDLNNVSYYGLAATYKGVIPPNVPSFSEQDWRHHFGSDEAVFTQLSTRYELPTLEFGIVGSADARRQFELFKSWLVDAGYPTERVQARTFPSFGAFNQALAERDVMIAGTGWQLDYPDAANTLALFYGPNQSPGANAANYVNPEFDALYERAQRMTASQTRTALYQQMNQLIKDDCVAISGVSRRRVMLWHKDFLAMPQTGMIGGYWLPFAGFREPQ